MSCQQTAWYWDRGILARQCAAFLPLAILPTCWLVLEQWDDYGVASGSGFPMCVQAVGLVSRQ